MVVGIIGYGAVGEAVASYYKDPIICDPPKGIQGDLTKADYIFICVPTPDNNGFDLGYIENAIENAPKDKVLILKSTVLPGTTRELKKKYGVNLHYNPEFLSENNAKEHFANPQLQVIGTDDKKLGKKLEEILPLAEKCIITDFETAESIKIVRNVLSATKLVVLNEVFDALNRDFCEWETIKEGLIELDKIDSHHLDVEHKGGRGAGGKCLRKDFNAFSMWANSPLLKLINIRNHVLLEKYPKCK